ncbi:MULTISPECIES: DUF3885 domain-containing protein [unclassified Sphingomonas]|uniref:DUF3885 domain-containing protein n=1 Tax=unclassified Sphingomonas TaxID=196159 RepID=UPI00285E7C3E|nr:MULTISPECIES: DUF3885 domain-containing protein [unclassified Sphingomonas]MDR6114819.1 hypothetical protein [Sphingomonas sp. SORGH_AS_0789]MDR6151508.1 hypothetical protein [Sphingomonas sp. SORGH_AS_0742]
MASSSLEQLWSFLWTRRFTDHEARLRFELGGDIWGADHYPIPRFLQALHRATAIADVLFPNGCHAVVASIKGSTQPEDLHDEWREDGFSRLQASGFSAAYMSEWQSIIYPDDSDDAYCWTLRGCRLGDDRIARDCLIWHGIAAEMPISPSAPVVAFLLDPDAGTMLHIYDDRGMDVMACDAVKLSRLQSTHASWLLEDDRTAMGRLFDPS